MTRFLLVVATFALTIAPASVALACSGIPECSPPSGTLPADGASDVPLNVELEGFLTWPTGSPAPTLALRNADTGEEVALVPARTPGRMRAELPLSPSTRYELLVPREIAAYESATCDDELVVRATFTTGTIADDAAPTSLTASGGGCSVGVCTDSACCGPYVAALSSATWSATDDGALPIAYAFGSPEGRRTFATSGGGTQLAAGMFIGGGAFAGSGLSRAGSSPVFAIDAAGNVSAASASFAFDFSCAPSREEAEMRLRCDGGLCSTPDAGGSADAGADARMDGGGARADAGDAASPGSGCAVVRSPRAPFAPVVIATLAAIALAARRRKRARR